MRLLRLLLLLLALHVAGPALAGSLDDAIAVTVLRGSSAPSPPVAQQTVLRERTIVEYRYVPYEAPVYFPAPRFPAASRIVRRHHN